MGLSLIQQNKHKVGGVYRVKMFLYFFYITVFLIFGRFFYLQIIKGSYYQSRAQGNTERNLPVIPPRGLIFDRNGVLIAQNKNAYSLSLIPAYLPQNKNTRRYILTKLSQQVDIPYALMEEKYLQNRHDYRSFIIKESLDISEVMYLKEHQDAYPFLNIIEYSGRIYPYKESLSHVLGYIGSISKKEYNNLKDQGYKADMMIGKAGIEKEYDTILRGEEGQTVHIVNSIGKSVQEESTKEIPPILGKNLVLSIDTNVQDIAFHSLKGRSGAVIVTKVATGEVIALVSSPGYDANQFINASDGHNSVYSEISNDPSKPFLNRAIQGQYPPGSIFKIVTAVSALEDRKVDPYKKEDTSLGYFKLGKQIFKDDERHMWADMPRAISDSNDVYFYRLTNSLGYASILEHAIDMGLKQKTGIDLPGEMNSFIPTPEWKEKRFHEVWVDGDTINIGIGQGFLLFTPIGVHNIVTTIATGHLIRPHIVWQIKNPYSGAIEKTASTELISNYSPRQDTLDVIREGMMMTPYSGTAKWHQYISKVKIAGKTGTAQTPIKNVDDAWFTSYGPTDKPISEQYAITVVIESSGYGSGTVPISSVLYNYLEGAQSKDQAIKTLDAILPSLAKQKEED